MSNIEIAGVLVNELKDELDAANARAEAAEYRLTELEAYDANLVRAERERDEARFIADKKHEYIEKLQDALKEAERQRDEAQQRAGRLEAMMKALPKKFEQDFDLALKEDDPGEYELPVGQDGIAEMSYKDVERIVQIGSASLESALEPQADAGEKK